MEHTCLPLSSAVQDAASKKSNSLLLDTSDLTFSRYSLLGETPPRSPLGSPAIAIRDSSSSVAPPGDDKKPAPVGEEGGQMVTAEVCPRSDPDLNGDVKSERSIAQSCAQSAALPSPVIVVTQEFDESAAGEACCLEEPQGEVRLGTDTPLTTAELSDEATTDSDAAVTNQAGALDAPANQDSTNPIPDSPDLSTLSSPQATDVPTECAQSDQSSTPENSATPDLSTSDRVTEDTTVQHPCPSSAQPPGTRRPTKISLGSRSEVIGCNSTAPSITQTMPQQPTDRAVYLTGEIKDNWEVQRVKEENQTEAAEEKEVHERIKEGKEETQEGEGKEGDISEGQMEGVAQSGGEGCQLSESPAESATALTTEQREREDEVDDEEKDSELETMKGKEDDEEEGKETEDHAEKVGKKEKEEEVLQSPQPMDPQPESAAELPLDSVAIIRELVIEITEVDTVVGPCPNSSHTA